VPDGDLFETISSGKASIVTDQIETFTETGIKLVSGAELEADVIVTATGLNLLVMGGIQLLVDGRERPFSQTVGYKGIMFSGLPNLALTLGYTNASWTLKGDLAWSWVCRLLNHMDAHGYDTCTPRDPDPAQATEPFIDLRSGYVLRSIDQLPRQGARLPWRLHQNYVQDVRLLKRGPIADEALEFSRTGDRTAARPEPVAI
jgi:monooxygenase